MDTFPSSRPSISQLRNGEPRSAVRPLALGIRLSEVFTRESLWQLQLPRRCAAAFERITVALSQRRKFFFLFLKKGKNGKQKEVCQLIRFSPSSSYPFQVD